MSDENKNIRVKLKDVRLSYSDTIWEAKQVNGQGKPKHSATFILDKKKDADQIKIVQDAINKLQKEHKLGTLAPDRICLHDGTEAKKDDGTYADGYGPDMVYIRSSAYPEDPPKIINGLKEPVGPNSGKCYAGARVDGIIDLWPQNHKQWGKRVNSMLKVVQHRADAPKFARGGVNVDEECEEIPQEEEI